MKIFYGAVFVLFLAFVACFGYWYMNPSQAPAVFRKSWFNYEFRQPASPVKNYRMPDF